MKLQVETKDQKYIHAAIQARGVKPFAVAATSVQVPYKNSQDSGMLGAWMVNRSLADATAREMNGCLPVCGGT
jgi:hypothetical protein